MFSALPGKPMLVRQSAELQILLAPTEQRGNVTFSFNPVA